MTGGRRGTSDPVSFLYPCRSALVLLPFLLLKGRLQIKTYGIPRLL